MVAVDDVLDVDVPNQPYCIADIVTPVGIAAKAVGGRTYHHPQPQNSWRMHIYSTAVALSLQLHHLFIMSGIKLSPSLTPEGSLKAVYSVTAGPVLLPVMDESTKNHWRPTTSMPTISSA